jgi:hypothetical protein
VVRASKRGVELDGADVGIGASAASARAGPYSGPASSSA